MVRPQAQPPLTHRPPPESGHHTGVRGIAGHTRVPGPTEPTPASAQVGVPTIGSRTSIISGGLSFLPPSDWGPTLICHVRAQTSVCSPPSRFGMTGARSGNRSFCLDS